MTTDGAKPKSKHGGVRYSTKPRCGAKTNEKFNGGRPCQRIAGFGTTHVGTGRCKLHGGNNPIKHGLYSQVVPRDMMASYLAAVDEGTSRDMTQELALLDGVIIPGAVKRGVKKPGVGELDPLQLQMMAIETKSKVLKRLHDMEDSQKIKFTMAGLEQFLVELVTIVAEFVDGDTLKKISARIGASPVMAKLE